MSRLKGTVKGFGGPNTHVLKNVVMRVWIADEIPIELGDSWFSSK